MESTSLNEKELLDDKLNKVTLAYYQDPENEGKHQALLEFLQNNDCREVMAKCADGDNFANACLCAGYRDHRDILEAFLKHRINASIKDQYGDTALIAACSNGHEELVRLLLAYNIQYDSQDDFGWTALMFASCRGYKEIVQLLLDHGADANLKNSHEQTAIDLAKYENIRYAIKHHVNTSYVLK